MIVPPKKIKNKIDKISKIKNQIQFEKKNLTF